MPVEIIEYYESSPRVSRSRSPVVYKNKLIALLIDTFGFGYLGLDRIYLGCYLSGVIKFAMLVLGMLLIFTPNSNAIYAGTFFLSISMIWNFVDTVSLYYNAITMKYGVPYVFCKAKRPVRWVNYQNIVDAKNIALVLILIFVFSHIWFWNTSPVENIKGKIRR